MYNKKHRYYNNNNYTYNVTYGEMKGERKGGEGRGGKERRGGEGRGEEGKGEDGKWFKYNTN